MEVLDTLIRQWFDQWGELFHFVHTDTMFIFRRLSRREYKSALKIEDTCERDEEVAKLCVLWPQGWQCTDESIAGTATVLCSEILRVSGCGGNLRERMESLSKFVSSDLETQMETLIEYTFGGDGNFRKYKDWSYEELFQAYWRAKWIMEAEGKQTNMVGTQNNPQLNDKQRVAALQRARIMERREQIHPSEDTGDTSLSVLGEDGQKLSLDSAVSAYASGPAALQNMAEAMKKHRKYNMQQALRKKN